MNLAPLPEGPSVPGSLSTGGVPGGSGVRHSGQTGSVVGGCFISYSHLKEADCSAPSARGCDLGTVSKVGRRSDPIALPLWARLNRVYGLTEHVSAASEPD